MSRCRPTGGRLGPDRVCPSSLDGRSAASSSRPLCTQALLWPSTPCLGLSRGTRVPTDSRRAWVAAEPRDGWAVVRFRVYGPAAGSVSAFAHVPVAVGQWARRGQNPCCSPARGALSAAQGDGGHVPTRARPSLESAGASAVRMPAHVPAPELEPHSSVVDVASARTPRLRAGPSRRPCSGLISAVFQRAAPPCSGHWSACSADPPSLRAFPLCPGLLQREGLNVCVDRDGQLGGA